ncbi:MAG: DUF3426 domain-containing protein [Desulfosalsimonadaceae bacterium]
MIITCESCGTRYKVNEDLVKPEGIWARCSTCKNMFLVHPKSSGSRKGPDGKTVEETRDWDATYDESDFEETAEATEDSGLGTTTDFENQVEGMIDEFDEGTSFEEGESVETLEETSTIDLEELQPTEDTIQVEDIEKTSMETDLETFDRETDWLDDKETVGETSFEETTEAAGDASTETTGLDKDAFTEDELGIDPDLEAFELDLEETVEESPEAVGPSAGEEFELDLEEDGSEATEREYEIDLVENDMDGAIATEDFGLDLGDDAQAGEQKEKDAESAGSSDDEFTVELDLEPEEAGQQPGTAASDEEKQETLDFDLDEIDDQADEAVADKADEDFDLDFELDFDLEDEKPAAKGDDTTADIFEEDEFDLTEVEDFLDIEEESREPDSDGDEETFELDFETEADATGTEAADERAFDLDLETVKEDTAVSDEEKTEKFSMETYTESREESAPEAAAVAAGMGKAASSAETRGEPFDRDKEQGAGRVPPSSVIPEKGEKSSSLKIVVILLILLAIAVGGYFYMQGSQAPAPPETSAPVGAVDPDGKLQIAISTPDYQFVNNENVGELMVVTGSITNRYGHSRDRIQVRGNLYDSDGEQIQSSAPVYAGVVYETDALATMTLTEIENGLSRPAEDTAAQVAPEASMPFMVAFADLPEAAEELNVEVVASSAAGEE